VKDLEPAERLLIEVSRSMGLVPCAKKYGRRAIQIAEDFDGFDVWLETARSMPVRARARVLFAHEELTTGTPQAIAAAVQKRCAEAKAAIVANLKATLATLAALEAKP
jgi:hypothetical protein